MPLSPCRCRPGRHRSSGPALLPAGWVVCALPPAPRGAAEYLIRTIIICMAQMYMLSTYILDIDISHMCCLEQARQSTLRVCWRCCHGWGSLMTRIGNSKPSLSHSLFIYHTHPLSIHPSICPSIYLSIYLSRAHTATLIVIYCLRTASRPLLERPLLSSALSASEP